jgi:hypothetical protein
LREDQALRRLGIACVFPVFKISNRLPLSLAFTGGFGWGMPVPLFACFVPFAQRHGKQAKAGNECHPDYSRESDF